MYLISRGCQMVRRNPQDTIAISPDFPNVSPPSVTLVLDRVTNSPSASPAPCASALLSTHHASQKPMEMNPCLQGPRRRAPLCFLGTLPEPPSALPQRDCLKPLPDPSRTRSPLTYSGGFQTKLQKLSSLEQKLNI